MVKKRIPLLILALFIGFTLYGSSQTCTPKFGFIRLPLRGNAFDIHFINISGSPVSARPNFYTSTSIPSETQRNILFIPNTRINNISGLPPEIKLKPIQRYNLDGKNGIIARKSIQGIVIYNNPVSYKKYVCSPEADFTTYSSFMWTNGTRAQKDGVNSFRKAMDDINNLSYSIEVPIDNGNEVMSFDLKLKALSNLNTTIKEKAAAPGIIADFNNIAAILTIVGGILNIPTNPAAGIIGTLSGVAWTISGTLWQMNDDYNYTLISLYNKGLSWLSSPFDILVYPENYTVKDKTGKTIAIPEFDRERCSLTYFRGTNSNPQSIIVQLSSTIKGDLYVYVISKAHIKSTEINNLLKRSKIYLKNKVEDVIEQKK